jgi:hypothetical protein
MHAMRALRPLLLGAASCAVAAQWQPSHFIISAWVDPVVNTSDFPAQYALYAAAGFTTLLGGFGATTPAAVAAQVAAAAGAGLDALPSACESAAGPSPGGSCIGAAAPSAALAGYQMADEPSAGDFPALAAWMASVAARAPGALRFVNLLPNYANTAQLGAGSYAGYLAEYIRVVAPDMLCFDAYPVFGPGSANSTADNMTMAGYIRNLAAVRAAAAGAGLRFMNFFNTMVYDNRSDLSEGQLRWQAWTSVAHGAAGVLYFCYWTPAGADFAWAGAIMTPRAPAGGGPAVYGPGAHYAQAARLNARLRALGGYLLNASSLAVLAASGAGAELAPAAAVAAPLTAFGGAGAGPAWSLMLGIFALPPAAAPRARAALLVNQDPDVPALATVQLAAGAAVFELDAASGELRPALDDAPALPGLQLALDAGDARLLVF